MIASDLTASSKTTVNTKTTSPVYLESTAKNHALYNNVMTEINNTLSNSVKSKQQTKKKSDKNQEFTSKLKMLNKDASNGVFEKKEFKINQKALNKTPIYHFFHSQTEFNKFPEQPIEFTCIVCFKKF